MSWLATLTDATLKPSMTCCQSLVPQHHLLLRLGVRSSLGHGQGDETVLATYLELWVSIVRC